MSSGFFEIEIILQGFLIVLLIIFSGVFTSSEVALFSLSRLDILRLKEHTKGSCRLAAKLLQAPRKVLATILIGNEFSDIVSSSVATALFIKIVGPSRAELYAFPIMTVLLFLFGDLLPKVFAFRKREAAACFLAPILRVFVFVFSPFRVVMLAFTEAFLSLWGLSSKHDSRLSEEDLLQLVEESYRAGILGEQERRFIHGLLESEKIPISAIMTPRRDIFALEDCPISDELLFRIKRRGVSRIPVYQENFDNVIGILHVKDLLRWKLKKRETRLSDLVRPCFFVPETMKVRSLLEEFQKRRLKFALVVDEYGTIVGLVTLEDILEELFGEIYDEFDVRREPIQEIAPGIWRVSARLRVEEFNRFVQADLPSEEFDTIGGLVLHVFGKLPREGESKEAFGFKFTVERLKGTRLISIRVEKVS
ncbi:hemolysin family protein [Thermodesulfatator atlanticus]|uniref:hemolysin family protein n=1 Tax=Thermodesulfatator atlanticus TaxID=501497 RepID=UPI0003B39E4C|nr:hemolysin family protein [Thermodesulfatator atlanticus]